MRFDDPPPSPVAASVGKIVSFGSRSLPPPTANESQRMDMLKTHRFCVACLTHGPVELHHILSGGGLRLGHRYTVSLCRPCHSGVKTREFKARYPNQALLDASDYSVGWPMVELPIRPERSRKRRATTAAANQVKRPQGGFA